MAITRKTPNTILLYCSKDQPTIVNDLVAYEAITPGQLVEQFSDGGVMKWRKNSSATNVTELAVALNQPERNDGVDTAYAAGDLVQVWKPDNGDIFWGLIPSGQDISIGDSLQSNGDGYLKEATSVAASANVALFKAQSAPGAVTVLTRVKAEVAY